MERQFRAPEDEESRLWRREVARVDDDVDPFEDQLAAIESEDAGSVSNHRDLGCGNPDHRAESCSCTDDPPLSRNPAILLEERPIVGDLDQGPSLVEREPEARCVGRVRWVGNSPECDGGTVDSRLDRPSSPFGEGCGLHIGWIDRLIRQDEL
jgi:hypothetical protein